MMIRFQKDYVNDDHNQHDDVLLDLMFHNDAKKQKFLFFVFIRNNLLEFVV